MGHRGLQRLSLSAYPHEDYQACPEGTAFYSMAFGGVTQAVCEMLFFVDRITVSSYSINTVFCVIFDQF